MKLFLILFGLLTGLQSLAQLPATEVYLVKIKRTSKGIRFGKPVNISNNPGYDNQPSFSRDGKFVYYAGTFDGQTDIVCYDIKQRTKKRITNTPGGEFSPTPIPGRKSLSAICLEPDGTQRLKEYPLDGSEASVLIPEMIVGYHTWASPDLLYTYVLDEPNTLRKVDMKTLEDEVVAENVGRSLQRIPKSNLLAYVDKSDLIWFINTMDLKTNERTRLIDTKDEIEDMAWLNQHQVIMGDGDGLQIFDRKEHRTWVPLERFKDLGTISRLAIHPKGKYIAFVIE